MRVLSTFFLLMGQAFFFLTPGNAQSWYQLERDYRYGFSSQADDYFYAYTPLTDSLSMLVDLRGRMSLDSLPRLSPSAWQAFAETPADSDLEEAILWLRTGLKGHPERDRTYAFQLGKQQQSWQEVDIWIFYPRGDTLHKRTGLAVPPGEKDVRDAFNFFTVPVPAGDSVELVLRLAGIDTAAMPDAIRLDHIDTTSLREWNGYRVGDVFQKDLTPVYGNILNYVVRSVEILPGKDENYRLSEIFADSVWDNHARYNEWRGYDPEQEYWIRQRLIGDSLRSTVYTFLVGRDAGSTWTNIELYVPGRQGRRYYWTSGSKVPPAEKPVEELHNLFEVFVPAGDTVTVYAHLQTSLPRFAPPLIHLSQFDREGYEALGSKVRYWNGLFQGALWIQLLFSLLLYLTIRERREMYYAILIAGMQLFFLSQGGFDLTLRRWLPTAPEWWHPALNLGSFIAIFGLLKFTQSFLYLEDRLPRSVRVINGFLLLLGLSSVLVAINPAEWALQAWRVITAAGILMPAVFGLLARLEGYRPAGIFLWAVSVFILGAFAHLFSSMFFPQSMGDVYNHVIFKVGVVVMLGLMALAVGFRNQKLRREKEAAFQQNLENQARINQRLQQLDFMKDQFLANTSHELRTPLNGIIGLAESLRDGAAGTMTEEARDNLEMIAISGRRLHNLVNDILDFSKLKSRELSLRRQPIRAREAAGIVLGLSRPLLQGKEVRLVNAIPADAPLLEADENRLQQILHNLVGNAIKFTDRGRVELGMTWDEAEEMNKRERNAPEMTAHRKPRRRAILFVKDTGIGIPEDKQVTIFRSFEQVDGSTARAYGGTGLGLAVTKQLVELHGGRIWLESVEGEGTTFFFSMPLAEEEVQLTTKQADGEKYSEEEASLMETSGIMSAHIEGDKSETGKEGERANPRVLYQNTVQRNESIRILVVDDEPVNRRVLQNQISLAGYEVETAAGGREALDLLRISDTQETGFDLVILDIMMPKMSGYEVCHRLRQHYLPSELPVILLTAKNHVTDLVQGFEAGANDYLTKPFLRDELLSRIRTHLSLSRISRASGRFVPHEFIQVLGKKDITDVQLGDHQQREVTVLFSDIRDYTTLAELMTPEDNFKFVNAYAGRMGPIIQHYDGFVQQYLGDAIMAIFQKSPEAALRAAVRMQEEIRSYNKERLTKGRRSIQAGMGMHTGSLIMGIIGDQRRTDAATIADTVNTASRLEGLTKYYGVNILLSEESRSCLPDPGAFRFRYLGRVQVKGKHQPVNIYECIDGDPPDMLQRKLSTQDAFETGLRDYYQQSFQKAIESFNEVLENNPHDSATRLFLQRATGYLAGGVPDNWTGVETMRVK